MSVRTMAATIRATFFRLSDREASCWMLIAIASLFWVSATFKDDAFSAELYGDFALRFPAELWAALMGLPAAMILIGLKDPVKHWMVLAGAVVQVVQFGALGYSATFTGGEPIIGAFAYLYFGLKFGRMALEAASDTGTYR